MVITKSCTVLQETTTEVKDCEEYLCYTHKSLELFGANLPLVHNLIQVPIRFLGPNDSEFEFDVLVDTGNFTMSDRATSQIHSKGLLFSC